LTGDKNKRYSERRGERGVGRRKKRAMQRAARQAWRRREKERAMQRAARRARRPQEKETSDSTSGGAGKRLTGERNKRYSERRRGQGVVKRNKRAIQLKARRARHR
jgi:hypothetical protein